MTPRAILGAALAAYYVAGLVWWYFAARRAASRKPRIFVTGKGWRRKK